MVSKRTERRHRAKTTGAITVMLRAPRADIVAALVRGGYLVGGVVPSEKELQEAAQRHYTDSLKDGVRAPRILAEQPPLPHGVKIEPKAGKTAAQYDKRNALTFSRLYSAEEKAAFLKSRPDLADVAKAFAEAAKLHPGYGTMGKITTGRFLLSPSTPPYVGPRRTKNTGHIPTVKDKKKRESKADTTKPMKRPSKAEVKKVEKELGFKMEPDKGVHTLRPGKGGIEREADKWVAGELGGRRKYTGNAHYRDNSD